MNKRRKEFAVILAATVIAGGIITLSAFSMRAEADQRQQIYDEAVAIRDQREAGLIKAYEPYRLEAKKERLLVEKARADAEAKKKKADEAFANAIQEHPVPKAFVATKASEETSEKAHLLNCSYEYELERKLVSKELSEESKVEKPIDETSDKPSKELSNEPSSDASFDWSTLYGDSGPEYETFVFTIYSEVGGENPKTDSQMIQAVACAFLNNMRIYHRSPSEEAFKWDAAYSNCNCKTGEISCGEGTVCWNFIERKPEWLELVDACWKGKAESPIPSDYNSFRTPSMMGYEYLPISVFAKDNGIDEYVEIQSTSGDGIFFREEEY